MEHLGSTTTSKTLYHRDIFSKKKMDGAILFTMCMVYEFIVSQNESKLGQICGIILSSLISTDVGMLECPHLPKKASWV